MTMADQEMPTRTDLSDLVQARKETLGLSYERLAQRAIDPMTERQTVKGSWLHRLVSGLSVIPPQLPQLRALAVALEVPLGQLQDAAGAQFFGIDTMWSASGEARAFVERADRMTPDQRAQLMRLIDAFTQEPGD